jgi:hypothetical protein
MSNFRVFDLKTEHMMRGHRIVRIFNLDSASAMLDMFEEIKDSPPSQVLIRINK